MLKNRIVAQGVLFQIAGILLGLKLNISSVFTIILLSLTATLLITVIVLKTKKIITEKQLLSAIFVTVFLFSFGYTALHKNIKFFSQINYGNEYNVEGIIYEKNSKYIDIKITDGELNKGTKIRIYGIEHEKEYIKTEKYMKGKFLITISDCPDYIKADGISYYGKGCIYSSETIEGHRIMKFISETKYFLSDKINDAFHNSPQSAGFINAIILGDSSGLSDKVYSDYSRLGITHIIAVSGLHFAIIVMSLFALLGFLRINYKIRCISCILFAIFYCLLTGASPSSIRAAIMLSIAILGKIFLVNQDVMTSLFTAASLILIFNPFSLYSTSFVLSFVATFAIIITPIFEKLKHIYGERKIIEYTKKLVHSVFISLTISTLITTVLYSRFYTISIFTPVANLLISIIFTLIMYISLLAVIICSFSMPDILIKTATFVIESFHHLTGWLASLRGICIVPSKVAVYCIIITAILSAACALLLNKKRRELMVKIFVVIFCFILCMDLAIFKLSGYSNTKIVFSENGSSAIITYKGKTHYLVENENYLSYDFLVSNRIVDFESLIIPSINNEKDAQYKLDKFSNDCKYVKMYCCSNISNAIKEYTNNLTSFSYDKFYMISNDCISFVFHEDKSQENIDVLWLGDGSYKVKSPKNVKNLVLSKSFFESKKNIDALPQNADKIYIPAGIEKNYVYLYIERKFQDSQIRMIENFSFE